MKLRAIFCLLCIFLTLTLPGCWDRRELNTLSISHALGIDQLEDGQVQVSLQMAKPASMKSSLQKSSSGGGEEKAFWVVTTTGRTLFEALRNGRDRISRKSFFGRNKIIIIGEEAAKSGITPLLDMYIRRVDFRELSFVFVVRGKAQQFIEADSEQEKDPAKALENLAEATDLTSKAAKTTLLDVMKALSNETTAPFVAGLELVELPDSKKKIVKLSDTAVFKEDKLIGWFNEKETRGLLWIIGKVKSGVIVVESPDDESKKVALEIINASSKLKPDFIDGKPTMTVHVEELGNLGEQMSSINMATPENFKRLENRQAEVIREEINAALEKAQTLGVDIFKFGLEFHRKFPQEYQELKENWEKEFEKMTVNIEVKAKLNEIGLSVKPIEVDEE
ncbi:MULTISPECIES: Ger(x)C family spore germination protein [Desulfitobacterium]|uniref:Germination protein, Ger(X)C family n=1 Tax=Desulfitobacterium dehalogenans (strain ATCC 51507 / DSM 9161 / JW/IU-DC1) TaxID=756499 RepID=I4A438_DESDJ|nr:MULTISPECIES: Ger(x)C family spore germination protein [Desulfitobacterium]AFL98722.1 germination protein, Ger(X)C family [Desulfitobacterium dehalogenans ATCC 51507]